MTYIKGQLTNNEHVEYTGRISLWGHTKEIVISVYFFLLTILSILIGKPVIVYLLISALLLTPTIIDYYTTELAFTNKRIISKRGLFSIQSTELLLSKVESVKVIQSIIGRFFDFGTCIVVGIGSTTTEIKNISNPLAFRKCFSEYIDKTLT